jgi:hypothetical protein
MTPADCIEINERLAARYEADAAEMQRGDMDERRSARQYRVAAAALRAAAKDMVEQLERESQREIAADWAAVDGDGL